MKKKISINQLKPGMYVASTNRSWLHLPFFRRKIRNDGIIAKLKGAGVTEIVIDTRKGEDLIGGGTVADPFDHPDILTDNIHRCNEAHEEAYKATTDMMEKVRNGGEISSKDADVQVNLLVDQIMDDPQSMLCVSVLKNADEFTFTHCVNTAILALFVGKAMKMPMDQLLILGKGALLHDIGKCMVPNEILRKPGKLSPDESDIIQSHVERGVRYLQKMKDMEPEVIEIVAHHHERLDGSGYPKGLKGDQISFLGSLCGVIDVYDALIHENYYKESKDPTSVIKTLAASSGVHFHEKAFKALADCVGIYPPGTVLMLDTGEIALTYEPNLHNPYRPKVLLLTHTDGTFHDKPTPAELTEADPGERKYKRSIVTTMTLEETNFNPFDIMKKYSLQTTESR